MLNMNQILERIIEDIEEKRKKVLTRCSGDKSGGHTAVVWLVDCDCHGI